MLLLIKKINLGVKTMFGLMCMSVIIILKYIDVTLDSKQRKRRKFITMNNDSRVSGLTIQ